jgi:hypothetical protein
MQFSRYVGKYRQSGCQRQGNDCRMRAEKIKILFLSICLVSAVMIFGCKKHGDSKTASSPAGDGNDTVVIAYYFHKTIRCVGCLEIESAAKQVIENSFPKQIAEQKLIWVPFNLDDPGGKEFEKKFNVSGSTLVLSKAKGGDDTQYRKLEKTWELISDQNDFDAYVRNEVQQFLNE